MRATALHLHPGWDAGDADQSTRDAWSGAEWQDRVAELRRLFEDGASAYAVDVDGRGRSAPDAFVATGAAGRRTQISVCPVSSTGGRGPADCAPA